MSMDPSGTAYLYNGGKEFPRDITILGSHTWLEYANGSRADASTGVYTHHLVFSDVSKQKNDPLVCKEKIVGYVDPFVLSTGVPISAFAGTAEDNTPISFMISADRTN